MRRCAAPWSHAWIGSLLTACMLRLISYDVQAADYNRQREILAQLNEYDTVLFQGTRCKVRHEEVEKVTLGDFVTFQAGWTNKQDKHAGTSICLNSVRLFEKHKARVADVFGYDTGESSVRGRFLAV
eukprot:TRINITY_DN118044_c0_g1_i1.p2 TRINITY_DN118044_c0_g1~~TRINITY_DN118044_c0_g1_i1.p2  ORF type:complete len:127 (-),score=15.81 TRINITY_DN118044_c0_g1_i1:103-483(-)